MCTKSERMLVYLGDILKKKYPDMRGELSLEELLDWNLWPGYLKLYGMITTICAYLIKYAHIVHCRPVVTSQRHNL